MMRHRWLLTSLSMGVKRVLVDQDGHVRALLETAGDDYYCEVWANLHDASMQTTVNSFAWGAMEEAEGMLLDAGVEL